MNKYLEGKKYWHIICILLLLTILCLAGCSAEEKKEVTKDEYLANLAIPMLREVGEEMVNLGSFADDMQNFCVSSDEVRQNFDYILFNERLTIVRDTILAYPKEDVPKDCKRLHTTMLDLAASLDTFLADYPDILMSKNEKQLSNLFQNIYKHLNTGLNSLPDSWSALTREEVTP